MEISEYLIYGAVPTGNNEKNGKELLCSYKTVNECPSCKKGLYIKPVYNEIRSVPETDYLVLHSLYICPCCGRGIYALHKSEDRGKSVSWKGDFGSPIQIEPNSRKTKDFPKEIKKLSPNFVEIYNQAYRAEQQGLNRICGVGYRKALEFLTKDYAISRHPDKKDYIEDMTSITACIREFIQSPQAEIVLNRAAWLGNDQTHYKQKHTTKDLEDLKLLIDLSVTWINATLETEKAGYEITRK